ncbi:MAG: type II secretion system F family protein [Bacteroidota bacterium]
MSIDLSKYNRPTAGKARKKSGAASEGQSISDLLNKDISLFGNQLSMKKKEAFYTELEVLLKAGLDLKTALDLIEEGKVNNKDKALLETIRQAVIQGDSLSGAMKATKKFSPYEIYSIQIAEESGKLPPVLVELSSYFAKSMQYRRLLISALSYPVLVITVSLFALVFLLNFLVPLFSDIYARLNQDLPGLTLFIVNLSDVVQKYLGKVLLGLGILVTFFLFQRKKDWARKLGSSLLMRLPIFGGIVKQLYLARFSQAMSFLLGARVPLLSAIDLIRKMVGFYPIEKSLDVVEADITKGHALHHSLRQFKVYPRQMVALVKVGEEANQLDVMFKKLAEQYNEEVEQRTKTLGSLIEPVLIVFLALIVGLVLVSMYLPIFKLVTNFGL